MNKKLTIWLYILEVIGVLIAIALVVIFKFIPEYQASLGSSEKLFSYQNYKTAIEIKITSGPEFFMIIDKTDRLSYIFIENEKASFLANKNIEGKKLENAIDTITELLEKNNYLKTEKITIINYNENETFNKIVELFQKNMIEIGRNCEIIKQQSTFQEKAKLINFDQNDEEKILWALYLKSRELMENIDDINVELEEQIITKDMAEIYADAIYQKLTTYMITKNIKEQAKDDMTLPIYYIPGDSNNQVYPTTDSWYYIEDYKVFAQISIASKATNYIYCYEGSEELKKEGSCT